MRDIWLADRLSALVTVTTFALVLVIPLENAVLAGAAISVLTYIYVASLDIEVVQLDIDEQGRAREVPPPRVLENGSVTVLDICGSLFFAAGPRVKELLREPGAARRVVVLRLRGRGALHSASIALLRECAASLATGGRRLFLAGVGPELKAQLERTGPLDALGEDAVVEATETAYGSC